MRAIPKSAEPWKLPEAEWPVTERMRVATWVGRTGVVRLGIEDRFLEEQAPSLSLAEAKRLADKLGRAIAWAERAVKASTQ